jgi:hypothetical protein
MKKLNLIICLASLLIWISCKNNPEAQNVEKDNPKAESATKTSIPTETMMGTVNDMKVNAETLRNTTPISKEVFKAWLPDELLGMRRTGYTLGALVMGEIASVEANYISADNVRKLKLELMDCAGEMGASVAMAAQVTLASDYEEESESKRKRTLTKNGVRAVEEYQKKKGNTILECLVKNRFYVKVTGEKMEPDDVWEALVALKVKSLIE